MGLNGVRALVPELPRIDNIGLNVPVLLFALGISTMVGILFGLLPAMKSSKTDLQTGLKQAGRGAAGGHHRTQGALVVVQIALALVLLTGGSLLYRTIHNLWAANRGFTTRNIISFHVGRSASASDTARKVRTAYQQMVERIRQVPGVEAADFTALVPLGHRDNSGPFWVGSRQPASLAEIPRAIYYPAGPEYPNTMQIPLLRGRYLSASDNVNSGLVVLIDSLLARTYFPGRDALGQIITIPNWGAAKNVAARVVGVVGHVEHYGLAAAVAEKPQIYFSFYQLPDEEVPVFRQEIAFVVRTARPDASVMPAIQQAVSESGSDQPIYDIRTMQELVSKSMDGQRFPMILLSAFAILALLLACVGIYGVISYSMAQRVREIGIRMALGAMRRDVLQMVIGNGLRLALAGVAIGTLAALILTRVLSSFSHLLYGVHSGDPLTFVVVSTLLLGAALLACYIPARRAASVDPMVALRYE
jgi:putative ABC transport system permease protein